MPLNDQFTHSNNIQQAILHNTEEGKRVKRNNKMAFERQGLFSTKCIN